MITVLRTKVPATATTVMRVMMAKNPMMVVHMCIFEYSPTVIRNGLKIIFIHAEDTKSEASEEHIVDEKEGTIGI